MNTHAIASHVEFATDQLQQAIDDATEIASAAELEARYDTTRADVLEHMTNNLSRSDDKIFMRALRIEDRQSIAMMLDLIQKSFKAVVAEKKSAILARKPELHD